MYSNQRAGFSTSRRALRQEEEHFELSTRIFGADIVLSNMERLLREAPLHP